MTAALVGVRSPLQTFALQRAINEYPEEPLLAVLPGVALQELWAIVGVAETALLGVSAMVVVTALIGLMATVLASLNERRREMAIYRAMGARPATILGMLVLEATVLAALGAVLGLALLYAGLARAAAGARRPVRPLAADRGADAARGVVPPRRRRRGRAREPRPRGPGLPPLARRWHDRAHVRRSPAMPTRRAILTSGAAALALPRIARAASAREIGWEDLIPPGVPYSEIVGEGEMDEVNDTWAPIFDENATKLNEALDGARIRMPGFVLPLELDARGVTEFMLVPYVGACLHVPPPPPNQLVLAHVEEPWPGDTLWEAVWVEGTMRTVIQRNELAQTGYALAVDAMEVYEW